MTPARLAQRVGRAARLGASHDVVHVYGLAPSPGVERWLRLGARLRAKARAARRAIGDGGASDAEHAVRVARGLDRWAALVGDGAVEPPVTVVMHAARTGFLAACMVDGAPTLVAGDGRRVSDTPDALLRAIRRVDRLARVDAPPNDCGSADRIARVWRRIVRWHRDASIERAGGFGGSAGSVAGRISARADAIVAAADAYRRPACARMAAEVRATFARPISAATEAALSQLLANDAGEQWLADTHRALASRITSTNDAGGDIALVALIVWDRA